mgnify:CR=1 FL=1
MNEEVKELINKLVKYNWENELKHFNDEFNDTNIYWDTEQEIEIAITDNWEDCNNHIFVTLFELDQYINKGE